MWKFYLSRKSLSEIVLHWTWIFAVLTFQKFTVLLYYQMIHVLIQEYTKHCCSECLYIWMSCMFTFKYTVLWWDLSLETNFINTPLTKQRWKDITIQIMTFRFRWIQLHWCWTVQVCIRVRYFFCLVCSWAGGQGNRWDQDLYTVRFHIWGVFILLCLT